jgi:two-component system, OmpR family, phosphate regulon response regulator PhoB
VARILVIEDEPDLQKILDYNLRKVGHDVVQALRGNDGLEQARRIRPDLILLDLMLPDLQGTEICKILKSNPETKDIPVIMLTAKGEEIDRVLGFELGVEDYVVKPFSVRELILRIQVILRRTEPIPEQIMIHFGCLRIDPEAHRAWVDEQEVHLTLTEFKLLLTLYGRRNRVQSRITLLEDVWGMNVEAETRTVDTHVKRLREKVGKAESYIETVRGAGYRFIGIPPETRP